MRDGHGHSALRGAIELGEHDAGDPRDAHELPGLREAVLPDRCIEDEQCLVRRAVNLAGGYPPDLLELLHQVRPRVQPSCSIDEDDVTAARPAGSEGVEDDGGGIRALAGTDHVHTRAIGPDLELVDGRGAESVGRADDRRLPLALQLIRELANRRRLAGAVDADDEDDARRPGWGARRVPGRPSGGCERFPRVRAGAAIRRAAAGRPPRPRFAVRPRRRHPPSAAPLRDSRACRDRSSASAALARRCRARDRRTDPRSAARFG